jgi:hypothetical protein
VYDIEQLDRASLPSPVQQRSRSRVAIHSAALRFERLLDVYQREIVSFDSKHQRLLKGGGAFGVVHAYVGFIEAQDRGALHAHVVLWSLQQQLIGREQLDHRRHALDAAANAPLVGAEKLFDKLGLKMDTRDAMIVTVGNPTSVRRSTVSRASCRAGEEARSQVRRAPRNARRGREHDVAGHFRFCLCFL